MPSHKRGRPTTKRVRTNFMLDEAHYAKLQLFLTDPKSGRMRYGAIQAIINSLLDKFMAKLLDPTTDPIEMLRAYGVNLPEQEPKLNQEKPEDAQS